MISNMVNCRILKALATFWLSLIIVIGTMGQVRETRVACIGNSITAGARLTDPHRLSYPAVLSSMLHEKGYFNYTVKNFGIGGATMIRFGEPNVWRVLDSLPGFPPDIVIIELGTNETVSGTLHHWEHIGDFERDYADYLKAIRKINPSCRIIICSPLDMVIQTEGLSPERIENLTERRPRVWQLRKRNRKIANKEDVYFLDLTTPFKGRADLMTKTDGVHPNQEGYHFLAKLVFDYLEEKKIVVK
jgi:sialate O-acetylesterase